MKTLADINIAELEVFLGRIGMQLVLQDKNDSIKGSFWGDSEAGLIGDNLYARPDTPFHSVLHEAGHYICMTNARRQTLHTNAIGKTKGDYSEEDAVCYLQLLLADSFSFYSQAELFKDMDEWGYSFRLGSAKAWFEQDSSDAKDWLLNHKLISEKQEYEFKLRH